MELKDHLVPSPEFCNGLKRFPGGSDDEESACNGGDSSLILGLGRSPEKEMAAHSSVLAWRIPGTAEPGGLPSMGLYRVRHDLSDLAAAAAATFSFSKRSYEFQKIIQLASGRPGIIDSGPLENLFIPVCIDLSVTLFCK